MPSFNQPTNLDRHAKIPRSRRTRDFDFPMLQAFGRACLRSLLFLQLWPQASRNHRLRPPRVPRRYRGQRRPGQNPPLREGLLPQFPPPTCSSPRAERGRSGGRHRTVRGWYLFLQSVTSRDVLASLRDSEMIVRRQLSTVRRPRNPLAIR
jgi:hypothetical protein